MICSDPWCNTSKKIASLSLFSFIGNFSLRIGVTARGHFASNSAYPCQASSSVFNCLPNWLGFIVRRVVVYSKYFSRLEEAGTRVISIIDIPRRRHTPILETPPSPRDHALFFLLDSLFSPLFFFPRTVRFFPIFPGYFPREESSSPDRNFLERMSRADYLSSGQIMISCIDCVGHSSSMKAR